MTLAGMNKNVLLQMKKQLKMDDDGTTSNTTASNAYETPTSSPVVSPEKDSDMIELPQPIISPVVSPAKTPTDDVPSSQVKSFIQKLQQRIDSGPKPIVQQVSKPFDKSTLIARSPVKTPEVVELPKGNQVVEEKHVEKPVENVNTEEIKTVVETSSIVQLVETVPKVEQAIVEPVKVEPVNETQQQASVEAPSEHVKANEQQNVNDAPKVEHVPNRVENVTTIVEQQQDEKPISTPQAPVPTEMQQAPQEDVISTPKQERIVPLLKLPSLSQATSSPIVPSLPISANTSPAHTQQPLMTPRRAASFKQLTPIQVSQPSSSTSIFKMLWNAATLTEQQQRYDDLQSAHTDAKQTVHYEWLKYHQQVQSSITPLDEPLALCKQVLVSTKSHIQVTEKRLQSIQSQMNELNSWL